jgi:Transglycosylase SLT domain
MSQTFRRSFVKPEHETRERARSRPAQRRSKAAVPPTHQRFSPDGRELDGKLSIATADVVHGDDFRIIHVVEQGGVRRSGIGGRASGERIDRLSICSLRHGSVQAVRRAGTLHTGCDARRERWRGTRAIAKGRDRANADYAKDLGRFTRRYGLGVDPYDPHDNLLAGAAYIRELYDRLGVSGFLAAYNAGPGRYENHLTTDRPLPDETQAHVAALAPMIGVEQLGGKIVAVSKSLTLARSPFFVERTASNSSGNRRSPNVRPDRPSGAHGVVDLSALVPQSGNLFVHRVSEVQSQ